MNKALYFLAFLTLTVVGCGKGPKGEDGASGKIVSTMNCAGTVTGTSYSQLNGLEIEYSAVLTSGGDVYATANVIDEAFQTSGTEFYAANQNGAQTALVYISADHVGATNGGLWKISLNRSTLITRVEYSDPDISTQILSFTPSACTVQNW